jgi:hypothetical protein
MKKGKKAEAYQKTRKELHGLPFKNMKEKRKAEDELILASWKRLASFKAFKAHLGREEFQEINEEFRTGIMCGYNDNKSRKTNLTGDDRILRVFKAMPYGVQVLINEKKPADPQLIASLARALSDSFSDLFFCKIGGLITSDIFSVNESVREVSQTT